jgi:hypothetical protein
MFYLLKQINSSCPYIASMIDVVREISDESNYNSKHAQQYSLNITLNDIE